MAISISNIMEEESYKDDFKAIPSLPSFWELAKVIFQRFQELENS